MNATIAVLPGDGTGKDVTAEAVKVDVLCSRPTSAASSANPKAFTPPEST